MSPTAELRWLCRLVDESLRPSTKPQACVSITREKENEILIASSEVVNKIQLRVREFDSVPNKDESCSSEKHCSVHQCLPKIITEMVILLSVKSGFVQHVAVKALVLTSQFVFTTGNNWNEFINFLCCSWEMVLARILSSSAESSDFDFLMQCGLTNCDWSTVTGITQALRVICKHLKEDYDDEVVKVFYDSVDSCLLKMPWDLLDEYWSCDVGSMEKSSLMNQLHLNDVSGMEPRIKFLGTLLQLLCSLVDRDDFVETGCDSADEHPLFVTIMNLIPRLVKWSLRKQEDGAETCIIHYLKHKLLVWFFDLFNEVEN